MNGSRYAVSCIVAKIESPPASRTSQWTYAAIGPRPAQAVAGIPRFQPDHTLRVAQFSLSAVRAANKVMVDPNNPDLGYVNIRVGCVLSVCITAGRAHRADNPARHLRRIRAGH